MKDAFQRFTIATMALCRRVKAMNLVLASQMADAIPILTGVTGATALR